MGFIGVGYFLSIVGIFGSIIQLIGLLPDTDTLRDSPDYFCESLLSTLLGLAFNIMLLIGISTENLKLLKIYRTLLKVGYFISIVGMAIFSVTMLSNGVDSFFIMLFVLGLVVGLFYLNMWFVNGVIAAIQSKITERQDMNYKMMAEEGNPHKEQV